MNKYCVHATQNIHYSMIIEAQSEEDAIDKAKSVGVFYDDWKLHPKDTTFTLCEATKESDNEIEIVNNNEILS